MNKFVQVSIDCSSRERRGIILGYVKNHPATFFRKIKKLNERCTQKVLVKIPKIFSGLIPSGCSRFENCIMLLRREEQRRNPEFEKFMSIFENLDLTELEKIVK